MTISAKMEKTGNTFNNYMNLFRELHSKYVEIGYFESQGKHYSGMTYPELMALHEFGERGKRGGVNIPPRPVFQIVSYSTHNDPLKIPKIASGFKKLLLMPETNSRKQISQFLSVVGVVYRDALKDVFGKTPPLEKNADWYAELKPNGNEPLVLEGDLKRHLTYKTSIDDKVM